MRKLSLILSLILIALISKAQQSPHGEKLAFSCTDCHTTGGWKFTASTARFSHDLTEFKLEGQHFYTDCKACHITLVFSEAKANCSDCHTDMHNNTVGPNCAECHTPKSWIVENITEIHQRSRFPLLGAHNTADCSACHESASKLEFKQLGVECIDCHNEDYQATTKPNHAQTGISTNCIECHRIDAFEWTASGINHDFFPLTKGHEIENCAACHTSGVTEPISAECNSCHQNDYNNATNPKHRTPAFPYDCAECHTTEPDWKPADFKTHDALYFPVYSGRHKGTWDNCAECHTQPENYNQFSCTDCHEHNKSDMDKEHREENGYSYNSNACFACHPNGSSEGAFNHSTTGFLLKGAHTQASCLECHSAGFAGTSALCSSCHTNKYNEAINPNHKSAGIKTECELCHNETAWIPSLFDHKVTSGFELTGGHSGKQCSECHLGNTTSASSECFTCHQANYNTAPNHLAKNYPKECLQCHATINWQNAKFDHNTTNFPLTGAHTATECTACHTSGYLGTPMLCNSCHAGNYTNSQNPGHKAAGISTECATCHTTTAWMPSLFNHKVTTGFELTGGHSGKQCSECHLGNTTSASSECFTCHQANYNTAPNHLAKNYPKECLRCHATTNWQNAKFDHNTTNFPLTGAHTATECTACHTSGYVGTPMLCNSCHNNNYKATTNPNHSSLGISTGCADCHSANPGWEPALFPNHNQYYALNGAHAKISSQCFLCHEGNYNNTKNTCYSCHTADYSATTNPAHATAKFPTDCIICHTETVWAPSTFNHDSQYFPIYSGSHRGKWNSCIECHNVPTNYSVFSCTNCHEHNKTDMDKDHQGKTGYVYNSTNCLICHPRGNS